MVDRVPGLFTLVLHSHLPWLAHHGRWPVGEEWLYQSWADCYLPVLGVLERLSRDGVAGGVSLGITPILAEQLDDPHCLRGMHHWLGDWVLRSREAIDSPDPRTRSISEYECRRAASAVTEFESRWRHGLSPLLRPLIDNGSVELLGGPLAHPFQPLLDERLRTFSLDEGLRTADLRWGSRPTAIWAPECGYRVGMEHGYARAGIDRFMVDGPALHGDTSLARPVHDSDVLAFGRDLTVSYRVWSPKSGYPGHADYRDFHTYDHLTGLKPARVTGRTVDSADKAAYDPARADAAIDKHVADFVTTVRDRLLAERDRIGRPAHVIAAFDTELFGHWWHEGPVWLERVLRALPDAGIEVGRLSDAASADYVGAPFELGDSSWGSGKDWRVWNGPQVSDLVELNASVVAETLAILDKEHQGARQRDGILLRDRVRDQIVRELILAVSSDWAFMVSKDSAEGYARDRARTHAHAAREIAEIALRGAPERALAVAAQWQLADGPFAGLDARHLASPDARYTDTIPADAVDRPGPGSGR